MSFHEAVVCLSIIMTMMISLWKWSKSLLTIILLELSSALMMAMLFFSPSSYSGFMIMIYVFFVSEALILLSSLYASMRKIGAIKSSLMLL